MKKAKRLLSLVMAMAMIFALAVSASASGAGTYSVTVNKSSGSGTESMASASVAGDAVVTAVSDGYKVTIPLKPAEITRGGATYTGYIINFTVDGASSASVTTAPYVEGSAEMSFVVATLPDDMTFAVTYDVAIYDEDGDFYCNHSSFPNAPSVISANIVLS